MGEATTLDFSSLGWADAHVAQLGAALTYAASRGGLPLLAKLDLYNNQLTDEGGVALAAVLGAAGFDAPRLKQVAISPISHDLP